MQKFVDLQCVNDIYINQAQNKLEAIFNSEYSLTTKHLMINQTI